MWAFIITVYLKKTCILYLFQDPDWGDNTTAVTGLSDLAFPPGEMNRWGEDNSGATTNSGSGEGKDYEGE